MSLCYHNVLFIRLFNRLQGRFWLSHRSHQLRLVVAQYPGVYRELCSVRVRSRQRTTPEDFEKMIGRIIKWRAETPDADAYGFPRFSSVEELEILLEASGS